MRMHFSTISFYLFDHLSDLKRSESVRLTDASAYENVKNVLDIVYTRLYEACKQRVETVPCTGVDC